MKTLKLFFTTCLLLTLIAVKSQNACFGTYVIIAEGSYYPDVRFTPYYSLNANWRVDSATWHFGDGTTLTSFSNYILHDYSANTDSLVDVCLVVTATDTINNISCTDTICRSVELCNPGINNSVNTIVNGATLSIGSYMSLYPGGAYPVTQTFDYGDGSANATHTFNANGNTMLSHTYASSGVYVLNVSSLTGSGCVKDTSIIITVASDCNVNASFTYAQVSGNTYQFTNTSASFNGLSSFNLWTFSNANGSLGFANSTDNPSFTFSGPLPYSAKLLVRDSLISGCADSIELNVPGTCATNAAFTFTNTGGNTYQFTNTSTSTSGFSSTWEFRHLGLYTSGSAQKNPTYTFTHADNISATLWIVDSVNSCTDSLYVLIAASSCDSITNMTASDVPVVFLTNGTYLSGNNSYGDKAKAERFVVTPGSKIQAIRVGLGKVTSINNVNNARFQLWDNSGPGGTPGNVIGMASANIATLEVVAASANPYIYIPFSGEPLTSTGVFYAGILLPTSTGDTVVLFTTGQQTAGMSSGWEQWSDNSWHVYDSVNNIRNYITAFTCSNFTCNTNAAFTYTHVSGNTYQFTNTSGSNNGYTSDWTFIANGVYEGSSTLANPQYTFTGSEPYTAVLRVVDLILPCDDSIHVAVDSSTACNIAADFTYIDNANGTVSFTNTSTSANPLSTSWYYYAPNYIGFDIDPNPHRSFLGFNGPYSVRLIVVDSTTMCRDTIVKTLAVTIPPCSANASFTYQFTNANTVAFTNTSGSNNGYWSIWTFSNASGPFSGSNANNPVVTLSGAAPYSAKLEVRDSAGGVCFDTVVQQLNVQTTCITLRPGSEGIDALASEILADSSLGSYHPDLNMSQWTYGGINKETRALLKYDLSMIPTGATITSAKLSLYAAVNTASAYPGQPTYGSNNASYIKQITAPWDESTVTWNNQPPTTTTGQVLLPQATSAVLNYLNIDIQTFAQNWVNDPTQNYGMMMDMITTNFYNALIFGSSDNPDSTLHPKLEICYIAGNQCGINAGYTYTTSNDTAILANTSTQTGAIGSYEVIAKYASNGASYSYAAGAFNSVSHIKLPQDSIMNVCLVAHDTSGTCVDTFCSTLGIWQPCAVVADFTFTQAGSAILVYNQSTGNYPPLTHQWQAPGAWPSTSTATDTSFFFSQPGIHQICLITTNAIGCKDTFCTTINNVPTDTLCGMVYVDANSNGIYDFGEATRPNSTVSIDGNIFFTNSTGFYKTPVASGTHVITLIAPPGWAQTFPDSPLTYTIVTHLGDYICGLDFGMRDDTLILSGIAYKDNNANGLYDAGDAPRPGVPVTITGINGSNVVYTNTQGYYSTFVYSGTYTISTVLPAATASTQPYNGNSYTITAYSASIGGLNFGIRDTSVTISGFVFVDVNNNGVYDPGDFPASGQKVYVGGTMVMTGSAGTWAIIKPAGTYTITYAPTGSYSSYTQTTPATITLTASTPGITYGNNNFGIYLPNGTGDVCITLSQITNVTPALGLAKYRITLQNVGNIPMTGTLEMNFDPLLTYNSANVTPTSVSAPNYTVTWLVSVGVGQTVYITPAFSVPSSAVLGTNVFNYVFYNPSAGFVDVNMACNEDTLHQTVLTSYDPNDKYVSPVGQGSSHAIRNIGEKLDYTIMFQNTGTSPAVNVILLDTVEADLDITSFEMRDASHEYHVQIEGREITWIFNNIMLPDSNTNVDSSMGYVSFSMNAVTGLADGTMVTNRAGIYFDFNDAVATGTAFNTIDKTTSISEIESGIDIALQPNPFTTYTNLIINGGDDKWPYTLQVYDMTGRVVQQATSMNNMIRIERNDMAQGIYMYEVKQNNKLIGKGKMIAE